MSPRLRSLGVSTPNKVLRLQDYSFSLGGPVRRDNLWFFTSVRFQQGNTQAQDVNYPEDNMAKTFSGRLTWQPQVKNKFTFYFEDTKKTKGHETSGPFIAEEAANRRPGQHQAPRRAGEVDLHRQPAVHGRCRLVAERHYVERRLPARCRAAARYARVVHDGLASGPHHRRIVGGWRAADAHPWRPPGARLVGDVRDRLPFVQDGPAVELRRAPQRALRERRSDATLSERRARFGAPLQHAERVDRSAQGAISASTCRTRGRSAT